MQFAIRNRWTGEVQFTAEISCAEDTPIGVKVGMAVKWGIDSDAYLRGADLTGAVLTGADLTGAVLTDAVLRGADLTDAVLRGAVLRGADLTGADLTGAVLRGADLTDAVLMGAVLRGADLTGAGLTGAVLTGAVLTDADLTGTDLTAIKDDIWSMLCYSPGEVPALIAALKTGRVNGSAYSDGECGCLVGTLSIASGTDPRDESACERVDGLKGNSRRPAERFFMGIRKGDTPATNQISRLAVEWCEEWLSRMTAAFGPVAMSETSPPA